MSALCRSPSKAADFYFPSLIRSQPPPFELERTGHQTLSKGYRWSTTYHQKVAKTTTKVATIVHLFLQRFSQHDHHQSTPFHEFNLSHHSPLLIDELITRIKANTKSSPFSPSSSQNTTFSDKLPPQSYSPTLNLSDPSILAQFFDHCHRKPHLLLIYTFGLLLSSILVLPFDFLILSKHPNTQKKDKKTEWERDK